MPTQFPPSHITSSLSQSESISVENKTHFLIVVLNPCLVALTVRLMEYCLFIVSDTSVHWDYGERATLAVVSISYIFCCSSRQQLGWLYVSVKVCVLPFSIFSLRQVAWKTGTMSLKPPRSASVRWHQSEFPLEPISHQRTCSLYVRR